MGDNNSNNNIGGRGSIKTPVYSYMNFGKGYFEKPHGVTIKKSIRPDYVIQYAKYVHKLYDEGKGKVSQEDAEKKANIKYGSLKDWIASERESLYDGDIYGGNPPSISTNTNKKPRRSRRSRRSRHSKKSRKSKKT